MKNVLCRLLTKLRRKHISGKGILIYNPRLTHFMFGRGAAIQLNGNLEIGANSFGNNKRSNLLRIDEGGTVVVDGGFKFMYGLDAIVFKGGKLVCGKGSFINSDCKLRCHKSILIGQDCKISHDFTVMDSDVHHLNGDNHTSEVVIGDHVWIGTRVTVLSGSKIGAGSVVAAGAVVRGEYPPNSLIGGVPAKILRSDIEWSN